MNQKNKIWMGWLAFSFLVFHFSLIFIYAFPEGILPVKMKAYSAFYVSPLYEQKWNMFAPCPLKSYETRIKYTFEDGTGTDWIKTTEYAKGWHKLLRFSHHGEIVLAEPILLYWVDADLRELEIPLNQELSGDDIQKYRKGNTYYMVKRFAYGNSLYLYDKRPTSAIVECSITNVKEKTKDIIVLPIMKWDLND